jgi:hypothetical protein
MNLTSSYSAFCVINKDINEYLKQNNQNQINYGDNPEHNIIELRRFFSILDGVRSRIFSRDQQSPILAQIGKILKRTDCLGKRNEDAAKKIIDEKLGENSCVLKSGAGMTVDMLSGVDAQINLSGTSKTSQIKPYATMEYNNGRIIVKGSSSTKNYGKLDLMVFVNVKSRTVKLISTKNMIVDKDNYIFPSQNEIMTIVGSTQLELLDCRKYLSENVIWQ